MAAVTTAQAQEAAFQKGVELVLHKPWWVGSGGGFSLGEEGCGVLLHQTVQRGLLGAVTLVVDRGAIRRQMGLMVNGLHARLPKW